MVNSSEECEAEVRRLLADGADASDLLWKSVAGFFGENCSPERVKLLLEAGANPNTFDPNFSDSKPLINAVFRRSGPEVVKLLLEAGADPNQGRTNGNLLIDALNHISITNDTEEYDVVANTHTVKLLLEAGADPNKGDEYGTPLLYAVNRGLGPEVVKLLLKAGADPNKVDPKYPDATLLSEARLQGNSEIIELLIEAGAK